MNSPSSFTWPVLGLTLLCIVLFSSYFGTRAFDSALGLEVDVKGSVYTSGATSSENFPTTNAFQPIGGGSFDAFVAKISPSGQADSEPVKNILCFHNPADNVPTSPSAAFSVPTATTIAGSGFVRITWTSTVGGGNSYPIELRVRTRTFDAQANPPCGGMGIGDFNDGLAFSDPIGLPAQPNHVYAIEQVGARQFTFKDLTSNIQSGTVTIPDGVNTGGGLGFSIEQLFTLNGANSAVYYFPFQTGSPSPTPTPTPSPSPSPSPGCGLGNRWDETEGTWNGVWTRRGATNVFDAVYTNSGGFQVTAVLTINLQGNAVTVARRQGSDGNDCDYTGTIAADGMTVQGTYQCSLFPGGSWQATIRCLMPAPQQRPLIFLPGNPGSSLSKEVVGPDLLVWPPTQLEVSLNELTLDPTKTPPAIHATDAIRYIPEAVFGVKLPGAIPYYGPLLEMLKTRGGYREYEVNGDPLRRTTAGCDVSQQQNQPTLFVFAYDWRFSATTNAQMLRDYIGCVQRLYHNIEVDILTHSTGGLVARRYILDNPSPHVVNNFITIAAPWLGAPKAINALETGDFFDKAWLDRFSSSKLKSLVEFFPGVHQLIPSRAYYKLGGLPFTEYQWDADGDRAVNGTYTDYTQLVNMLDYRYPNPASRPGTRGRIFHDHPGQDNWNVNDGGFNPDPTINYFHIYGRQRAPKTIGNVYTRVRTKCNLLGFNCHPVFGYDVRKTYGDGTVPLFSASRIGNGHDFNALDATLVPVYTDENHTELAQSTVVHDYILSVLRPASAPPTRLTSTESEHRQTVTSIGSAVDEQAYYLNISGTASVTITDAFGNSNAPADGSVFGGEVPGVTTAMLDAETFFVAMSTVNTFTITLRTGTEPIALELTKGTDTETVQAIRYLDVTLPGNVTAMLRITPQGVDDLRYDGNNDGTFETTVTPTVSVSGAAAGDTDPPSVEISATSQENNSIVTITSSDAGSGIRATYYSLDGTTFQAYTGPFTVNPYQGPVVYAFADDNVANRSSLVQYPPTAPLSTVQMNSSSYGVGEGDGSATITVTRIGDTFGVATVNYATSDTAGLTNCNVSNGIGSSRCDYATSVGTVRFEPGQTSETISIPIVDDAYAEGSESFTIALSSPSGGVPGTPASATVTINDNEAANGANPIAQTAFFVRQQYVDFLNREPDPSGYAAWQAVINNCPPGDTTCDRIHVSSAFFRSPEFQERGYFVYRFYSVGFGRKPEYPEFMPDIARVSGFLSPDQLEAAKVAFINDFMARSAFVSRYNGLNNTAYVDLLLSTAGVTSANRNFWITALGDGTRTRADVLREIAESSEVYSRYFNQAFVVMQYFGYLRRDPDAFYTDWIAHLNASGDYRSMINGFMNSLEYRFRFGP